VSATHPVPSGATPKRALLVDDDKMMLAVVGDMLHDLGVAEVVTGANGSAGLIAFDRMRPAPDVVVCDLNMPDGDGFQFMEKLGTRGVTGGVVLISGLDSRILSSATLMAKFHNLKILETLKKPVAESAMRSALAKLG
jgi:CheY-like chemotaxis protein